MEKLIEDICKHYQVLSTDTARKKWGNIPELTYQEVIRRLLINNGSPMADAFPEMSKATVSTMLCKIFPGKPKQNQEWGNYLLGLIEHRRCQTCAKTRPISEFYFIKTTEKYVCKQCDSLRKVVYRQENKEQVKEAAHIYYINNKESINSKHKFYYQDNKDTILERIKTYREQNKEKLQEYKKEYYRTHRANFKAWNLRRHIRLRRATPPWADMAIMNEIYMNRKDGEHTDHIVPLRGRLVSGLHTQFNLRNIPASENLSKSNKFDPETYVHELP